MKPKYVLILIISSILIFIMFLYMAWVFNWETSYKKEMLLKSEIMIEKVEDFKINKNKLPEKISDTGLSEPYENDPPWYVKLNNTEYEIYFPSSTLGESTTYNSLTKQWTKY